jgi:DivIVA domain-containing protein
MPEDDPEKRISELERQIAEPRAAGQPGTASTTGGSLTPELIRNVAFSKPPVGQRGYNEDEVDAFLDLVEAALRDPTGRTLSPAQVHDVAFSKPPIGKRGYNEDEVDAFLDFVEQQLKPQQPQQGAPPPPPPTGQLSARQGTVSHAEGESWPRRVVNAVIHFFAWIFQN